MQDPLISGLKYIISSKTDKEAYYVAITDDIVDMVNKYIIENPSQEWEFGREYDPDADKALKEAIITFETKMKVSKIEGGGGRRPKSSKKLATRRRRSSKRQSRKLNKRRK
jgi:hypothetical protein